MSDNSSTGTNLLVLLWIISALVIVMKPDFINGNWFLFVLKVITFIIPVYIFLFRVKNALLIKSIKSVNDLLIKTNETCINVFLDEDPKKNVKDIKKVSLYLTYLQLEINNFPYGGPLSSIVFLQKMDFYKKYKKDALKEYSKLNELITMDTIIENKTSTMTQEEAEELIDRIIHSSKELSNIFETHLKKYI